MSETLITAAIVGVLLFGAGLGMDGIRDELKRQQAVRLLETLDRALVAYHQATGRWPADSVSPTKAVNTDATDTVENDGSGDRMIAALADVPAARVVLQTIPAILRVPPTNARPSAATQPAFGRVHDPWGNALCCLTAASASPVQRKAVAANHGRPIFISAGADGAFGFTDPAAAPDNLRSDENAEAE